MFQILHVSRNITSIFIFRKKEKKGKRTGTRALVIAVNRMYDRKILWIFHIDALIAIHIDANELPRETRYRESMRKLILRCKTISELNGVNDFRCKIAAPKG